MSDDEIGTGTPAHGVPALDQSDEQDEFDRRREQQLLHEWEFREGWSMGRPPRTTEEWFFELRQLRDRGRVEQQQWLLGRPPETENEVEIEIRLQNLNKGWQVELEDRQNRAELEFRALRQAAQGENVRSIVLLLVVVAVVMTPLYAMATNVSSESFGQFLAPITGIAGTVIGYWFGQRGGLIPDSLMARDRRGSSPEGTTAPPAVPRLASERQAEGGA